MTKEKWKSMGYKDEESVELFSLDGLNAKNMGDIDVNTAISIIQDVLQTH